MYCLLCHEKIPRLRAWRTKSEFCCDEHAALYKKQTLERLLVEPGPTQNGHGQLPEPPEPEEFEPDDEFDIPETEVAEASEPRHPEPQPAADRPPWEALDFPGQYDSDADLPSPAEEEESAGLDELQRLAHEVGGSRGGDPYFASERGYGTDVNRQSADEALEALRQLANRATKARQKVEADAADARLEHLEGLDPEARGRFDQSAVLDEIRNLGDDFEAAGRGDPAQAEPAGPQLVEPEREGGRPIILPAAHIGEEDGPASILDELMEDPLRSWNDSRDARAGRRGAAAEPEWIETPELDEPPEPSAELEESAAPETIAAPAASEQEAAETVASVEKEAAHEAEEALQELVGALDGGGTDGLRSFDLEAPPEPDWEFGDDASELAALKDSLASTGAPEMRYEPGPSLKDMDVSPEEPSWAELSELEAVELDADEPPEPQLDAEAESTIESLPQAVDEPEPAPAKAARNGVPPPVRPSSVRHGSPGRFRAVIEFAEIHLEMAEWSAAASDLVTGSLAIRPLRIAEPEIAAPSEGLTLLPEGRTTGRGASGNLNMHEASVDLQPVAALDAGTLGDLAPQLEPAATPFAPGGLFFDVAGGPAGSAPAEDEETKAGLMTGGRNERP